MGSNSESDIELNLISLDFQSLTTWQKANLYTFLKRNGLASKVDEISTKVLCLASDLKVEELSETLEIEKGKFGKARGPKPEEKYKYVEVIRNELRELPRSYSTDSVYSVGANETIEKSQTSQANLTEYFGKDVKVSNYEEEDDTKLFDRTGDTVRTVAKQPVKKNITQEKDDSSFQVKSEHTNRKYKTHKILTQPLSIATFKKEYPTTRLDTIDYIESDEETSNGAITEVEEDTDSEEVTKRKVSTAKKQKKPGVFKTLVQGAQKLATSFSDISAVSVGNSNIENQAFTVNMEQQSMDTTVKKIGEKQLVPTWRHASTKEEQFTALENYILDLLFLKKMNLNVNEKALIFQSINLSNRTSLLHSMPVDACDSIDNFVSYLNQAYGRTPVDLRARLDNVKRGAHETMHAFMARVIRLYFMAHKQDPLTIKQISTSDDEITRQDIVYYFLKGIQHPKLATELKLRMSQTTLAELPDLAKQLSEVLDEPKKNEVNAVDSDLIQQFSQLMKKESGEEVNFAQRNKQNKFKSNKRNFNRQSPYKKNNNNRYEDTKKYKTKSQMSCYNCGKEGHFSNECRSTNQNRNRQQSSKPSNQQKPYKKETRKCHNCGKTGHLKKDCRSQTARR